MPNPVFIDCPEGAWTLVASNTVNGQIYRISGSPTKYMQTLRLTGEAAPTLESDGARLFGNTDNEDNAMIVMNQAIDVYIWCKGAAGRVRVDL